MGSLKGGGEVNETLACQHEVASVATAARLQSTSLRFIDLCVLLRWGEDCTRILN